MLWRAGWSRSWLRRIANVGGLFVVLCLVASGQVPRRLQEAEAAKDDFKRRVFLQCVDPSLSPPRQEYFFGPITAPTSTVAVPTVFEYDHAEIEWIEDTSHKIADDLNNEWNIVVRMRFAAVRTRSQGLTAAGGPDRFNRKPNGVWGMWTKWDDAKAGTLFEIGYLKKSDKGAWSTEIGPGLQPSGAFGTFFSGVVGLVQSANNVSDGQVAPFILTIDKVEKTKSPSCEALFRMLPNTPPERAPGHSLSDSYQRTQTIAENNASNGIIDSVNPAYVRRLPRQPVCYSIDVACHASGEGLWVPGDLEKPLDWNSLLQADACASRQSAQIEVVLKAPALQDSRKRFITCIAASNLARVRKNLIDLGVKDVPPTDIETTKNPSSPLAAPRNSRVFSDVRAVNGVNWMNGDPIIVDGNTNMTVKLSKTFITIEQGSSSAKFSIMPQGTGIQLTPPDARRREMYNTQNYNYANTDPNNGDKTGNYPGGPPPGMMTNLAPFVHAAMNAIDQAKQTPDGAKWDDQYFRNILKPYNTIPASSAR